MNDSNPYGVLVSDLLDIYSEISVRGHANFQIYSSKFHTRPKDAQKLSGFVMGVLVDGFAPFLNEKYNDERISPEDFVGLIEAFYKKELNSEEIKSPRILGALYSALVDPFKSYVYENVVDVCSEDDFLSIPKIFLDRVYVLIANKLGTECLELP